MPPRKRGFYDKEKYKVECLIEFIEGRRKTLNKSHAYCEATTEGEYTNDEIYDWLHDSYCLDCAMYENDECEEYPLSCPDIRKKFESDGKE